MSILWNTLKTEYRSGKERRCVDRVCDKCGKVKRISVDNARRMKSSFCVGCEPRLRVGGKWLNCKTCGKKMWVKKSILGRKKYCSKICANGTRVEVVCEVCGKESDVVKSRSNQRFCDKQCFKLYKEDLREKRIRNCQICGKQFRADRKSQRYCSRTCRNQYLNRLPQSCLSKSKTLKEKWDSGEFDYQRSLLSKRMKDGGGAKARKACGGRKTRPEMIFESYLKDKGIDYKYDEMVGNHATDFVVGKYAIEIDGNYWHNLENQKVKDEEINKMLTDNGYKVIRFWENEVLKDDNKIKNFLNQIGG